MTPIDRLIAADRANSVRVAIFGDSGTDRYCHGHFGLAQEGCPKFVEERRVECPAMAANAANTLRHWNAGVTLFSDGAPEMTTPVKTRLMVDGRCVFRHDHDACEWPEVLEEHRAACLRAFQAQEWSACLISDYEKKFLTPEYIRQVIDLCNERGVPVACDVKRYPAVYGGAVIKCNNDWWNRYDKTASIWEWPIVRTCGSASPYAYFSDRKTVDIPSMPVVESRNHVGAGDCFAAHLLLAIAHGMPLEDAATVAHSAGRVYVQHPHNRPPWPHEIRKDMDPVGGKIVDAATLAVLNKQQRVGEIDISWANGCFDLLGPHHAHLLAEAKKHGDVLVVGVNSDASVRRLKGPKRPVQPQDVRARMVAALACVDWVVLFDGDDPSPELAALRPDVRVCGAIPERRGAGDEHCGRVVLVPLVEGASTTGLIEKIRQSS